MTKPFIKWVGGKRRIAKLISSYMPKDFDNYYELFLGGGAVFLNSHNLFKNKYLSDLNTDLITTYKVVRDDIESLIDALQEHAKNNCAEYYYEVRSKHDLTNPISIASRFIYLNKTCFSGMYRVNSKGRFNSPYAYYKNPLICDIDALLDCNKALQGVELNCASFNEIQVSKNSVVYCDPPYYKSTDPYNKTNFSKTHQTLLAIRSQEWIKNGCKVILSNSDTELIRELYPESMFDLHVLEISRAFTRNKVKELLIVSK